MTNTEEFVQDTNVVTAPLDFKLCLPTINGFTVLPLEEIVYCEAQRSYTFFRLINNKSILISKPLFDYDKLLAGSFFLRIHKSFLINLIHVKEYRRGRGGSVIMSNGMQIEISRRKKDLFLSKVKESFRY